MMNSNTVFLAALLVAIGLSGCSRSTPNDTAQASDAQALQPTPPARWYTAEQVRRGGALFQQHCAVCHKPDASGDPNWKQVNAEGKLPPPPLNGTAHAWHHPLPLLRRIVRKGGVPMGGSMPPFEGKLNAEEIDAILAWVQSHWPDRIYSVWANQINHKPTGGRG